MQRLILTAVTLLFIAAHLCVAQAEARSRKGWLGGTLPKKICDVRRLSETEAIEHILFTPQSYHVASTESFSFTSYSTDQFEVIATLSYDQCSCNNRRRRCNNNGNILSSDEGTARFGQPVILDIQMPLLSELQGRNYFISVTSHNRSVQYIRRRRLFFSSDSLGFLLVKTDKPIYKPEQEVNFCMVHVDKSLRPFRDNATIQIKVKDAKFKQVLKFDSVVIQGGEFACLDFPLSDEPNLGTWRIQANLKIPDEQGGCHMFYNTPSASCTFKVEEFVLPRFEVTLEGPKQLTEEEDFITGKVAAKYTFGERVNGTVKINATLEASRRRVSFLFYERTARLDQNVSFRINTTSLHEAVRYRFDPFCVKSRVRITAEVEEPGRGTKQSDTISFPLVANPVHVRLADDNPQLFRAGLNYTLKAVMTNADGSPSLGSSARVNVTINNGQRTLLDSDIASNSVDGKIAVTIPIPSDANCLKIKLRYANSSKSCQGEQIGFSPSPMYSPTNSFLQLEDVSKVSPLKAGSKAVIQASSTASFSVLHLLAISQGSIQQHTYEFEREGTTSALLSFRVTAQMVPRVKVLGVYSGKNGELVADLIEIPVECSLENQVGVAFNQSSASPGDSISVKTVTSPGSVVLLSVIDKSLTLLADACRSLESGNICHLLQSLTRGSLPRGKRCDSVSTDSCCPTSYFDPTKYGVRTLFSAAGVSLQSNMFQPSPPRPIPSPGGTDIGADAVSFSTFFILRACHSLIPAAGNIECTLGTDYDDVPRAGFGILVHMAVPESAPAPTSAPDGGSNLIEEERGDEDDARTFFPESWIWAIQKTDENGVARLNSTVPDTITTWVAEAFALSADNGLGLSSLVELTVSKPFFASLELPFSVNFGETVTVVPLVFYFGRRRTVSATVSVTVDDDLDIVNNSLPESGVLTISHGGSASFNLKLRPRAIGQLTVTVSAVGDRGERDTVRKPLNVKPGCERFEVTQNIFAEGSGQHCFNYSLPSCVIPGSAMATITVTGDVMSPPNLDRLLVLPYGCGEQNLMKTATNWVVAEYLQTTEQLQDFTAVKIRRNIQTGYQRQLTYMQDSGCFGIWSRDSCSLWLTVAVVNTFSGIVSFYREQAPGTEFIDKAVVDGALNYIVRKQKRGGQLPIVGRVHNFRLLRDNGYVAHTAFGLLSLKQYVETFESSSSTLMIARNAISRAERYLLRQYGSKKKFCNYGHALATYGLLRNNENTSQTLNNMLDDLRSRIVISKAFPGACFLCNECPDNTRSGDIGGQDTDCTGRPRSEGSAACVETTGYALLALLEGGDTQYTVCLAQWLVKIRSGNGGFRSSQDTIVALQALAKFAETTYTSDIEQSVTFSLPGLSSNVVRAVNKENRFQRFDVEVPSVPSGNNCLSWTGNGTVIIQSTLEYHGCSCCSDAKAFSLELATQKEETPLGTTLELTIRIRYLKGTSSNMAIVDVEIPTGYIYTRYRFLDEFVHANAELERVDEQRSNVVFYFDDVRSRATTFIVEFLERFIVENPQQLPVTIYDYYDPGQTLTKYFLPSTSAALPTIATTRPGPQTG